MKYSCYRFEAVVDWIELEIQTKSPTNFPSIRKQGGLGYVEPINAGDGGAATIFRVMIQDPLRWQDVVRQLGKIETAKPFSCGPRVTGIEISLDAYSHNESKEELAELAARFYTYQTHPASIVARTYREYKGSGEAVPKFDLLIRKLLGGRMIGIGHHRDDPKGRWKADTIAQRIYLKTTDKGGTPIPIGEYRARTEITLRDAGLPCQNLPEWGGVGFEKLSRYFRYRMLTQDMGSLMTTFVKDDPQIGQRKQRNRKEGGTRLYSKNTKADTELNNRARYALRQLSQRWKRAAKCD